ncbi:MAG: glycogen/starch synthase [Bacteroidaceae bacterium]
MSKAKKVLYIAQEIMPYLPESEMAANGRYLPQAIQEKGKEIRTFMPKWGTINERRNQLHEVIRLSGMNLIIDDTDHPLIIKVASIQAARMQVYFIDNDDYFTGRQTVCNEEGEEYADNDARVIFFSRGVLETVKKLRWTPEIVHCHGWISALAPIYIKKTFAEEPSFRNSKVIFSLYEESFKNNFNDNFAEILKLEGIEDDDLKAISEESNFDTLSKLAIDYSDGLIINSAKVSQSVVEYARTKNIPILEYVGEGQEAYAEACNEFYDTIWTNEEEEDESL